MKLKLIINRFAPTVDGMDIDVNLGINSTFDSSGVKEAIAAMDSLWNTFKKANGKNVEGFSNYFKGYLNFKNSSFNDRLRATKAGLQASTRTQMEQFNSKIEEGRRPRGTVSQMFKTKEKKDRSFASFNTYWDEMYSTMSKTNPLIEALSNNFNSSLSPALSNTSNGIKNVNTELNNTGQSSNKAINALSKFTSVIKNSVLGIVKKLANILRTLFRQGIEAFTAAGDFVESINLYTMSVGGYATAGKKWAKEISEALYLDEAEIYQFTGQFFNLTRGLGASAEAADLMSRNLTQLSYDMASYLNIDLSVANNKLMSAMSGQTKAVTSVGVAVQSASLQELAYSLGIQKSVEEMTQAEKTYLRYIQIMRSTTQMQGDLGRTIITPTNAMRLLRTQLNLLSRAIGQVLTPIIMTAIPYVIAFTQALTELAQWLAGKRGYKLEDYLAPADSVKDLADGFEDLDNAAKGAGKSINRTLAPFDELNVVEMSSKGGSGGADTGSVLSDLEKYLDGYDMLEFYTDSMKKKVESIKKWLKDLEPIIKKIGAAFLTWKISSSVIDFFNNNKGLLSKKIGLALVITSVALSISGANDIKNGKFEQGMLKQLGAAFAAGGGTFLLVKDMKGMTLQKSLGISLIATGISFGVNAALDYKHDFDAFLTNLFGGALSVFAGTYMLTKNLTLTFGVTVAFAVVDTLAAWLFGGDKEETLNEQFRKTRDAAKEFNDEISKTYDEIYKNRDANLELVGSHQRLYSELKGLVDENGKVQEGYEDRVKFILNQLQDAYGIEYKLVDGEIQEYDKLKKSIEEIIAKKKLEILLEANKEAYAEAIKNERKAIDELNKSTKKLKDEEAKLKVTEDELKKKKYELTYANKLYKLGIMSPREYKELENEVFLLTNKYEGQKDAVNTLRDENNKWKDTVQKNTKAIAEYNNGLATSYSNDVEQINGAVDKMTGHLEGSLAEQLAYTKTSRDEMVAYYKKTNGTITEDQKINADAQYKTVKDNLINQSQTVKGLTPEIRDAWRQLAIQDKKAFEESIKGLPEDVRKELTDMPTIIQNDLLPRFQNAAATLGKAFGNGISSNMVVNKNTLQSTLTDAIQNVRLPRWLKNTPVGKMAENLGFQFYAKGGFPDTGEMFVAREAGPEMVGKIGNKTAVANNDQITTAMTNAMLVALNGANASKQPVHNTVYIGNKKVFDGMSDYVDSENDRYGTNYIRV